MRGFPSSAVASLLFLCAHASAQDLKYEKYKLDNGMTVILHEDHSLPVAAVNLWYRVGSKDEPNKRSGFAHLFEHLMFMGTHRVPGNEFDTIMEAGGGANNASTSSDRTNYYSAGPSNLLPTLLWLEADRLEDLGRTMDQEKLDKQRDVVRNERRQSYENRPYGKAELKIPELMYPKEHPYHIPVIGTHEDLEAATVSDVKDFFATFYVPANVALTVAGDFDPAKIKPLVADLFADLPAGGTPKRRMAEPVKLDGVKRTTLHDKLQLPLVTMVYHSPAWYADGDAEMDLVAAVLSRGKTSRLYKRLVYDDKLVAEISAYQDSSQLGSLFRIDALVNPGIDLEKVEKAIDEEVERLVKEGVKPSELEKYKLEIELGMLTGLQSVAAKADQLNEYEYIWGEPNSFKRDLERYRKASVDGVQKWAARVFTQDARLILRVLPEDDKQAEATTQKRPQTQPAPESKETKAGEAAAERKPSPRDKKPAISGAAPFTPPMPETFLLKNQIPVMLWTRKDLPIISMSIVFLRGGLLVGDTDRPGTVWMTADLLDEGTNDMDALQFNDAVQQLGARLTTSAERDAALVSLSVLKRNFVEAVDLASAAVRKPRLDAADFERIRKLHLEELRQHEDEPTIVASRVATGVYYGPQHRYGWPVEGTLDSVTQMTYDDIKVQYATIIRPQYAQIVIAGDISKPEALSVLEPTLGEWNVPAVGNAEKPGVKVSTHDPIEVLLVNRPDAVQTVIQFVMPGPSYASKQRAHYWLINTLLGGSFTSRLNMNLREQHGYTYGARSSYQMRRDLGHLVATSSVRADVTGESIIEFLREFERLSGGDISEDDANKARETLRTDVIESFSALSGVIRQGIERVVNGQPLESLAEDMRKIQGATASQLNALAREAVPVDKGVLVLVGDKKMISKELAEVQAGPSEGPAPKLKLPPPVEVDTLGRPIQPSQP